WPSCCGEDICRLLLTFPVGPVDRVLPLLVGGSLPALCVILIVAYQAEIYSGILPARAILMPKRNTWYRLFHSVRKCNDRFCLTMNTQRVLTFSDIMVSPTLCNVYQVYSAAA
ncbi:unnamed protein product, partial [Laminaria digitata]